MFNTTRVLQYSRNDTELGTSASRDEARAAELARSAARLRTTVDPKQIELASLEARQANDLIDRRTFSWTELFNVFETTLPDDVRITAVRPKIAKGQFQLTIAVVARERGRHQPVHGSSRTTGAFTKVGSSIEEHVNEQGQIQATWMSSTRPRADMPPAAGNAGAAGDEPVSIVRRILSEKRGALDPARRSRC